VTILFVNEQRGPGLRKARPRFYTEHPTGLVRTSEGRWRDLFQQADAISEGGVKHDAEGPTWFGSTSLILRFPADTPAHERTLLAQLARNDVHVRTHALRCARREAQSRAPAMLGRVACEVQIHEVAEGLRIDIDVQAPLIERRKTARTSP